MTQQTTHNEQDIISGLNAKEAGQRAFLADVTTVNQTERTVDLAFSSNKSAIARWFGLEVLGHDQGEVRLDRLNTSAALLINHNPDDQIGVVVSARIDPDGMGRATVRFSKSPRGSEIFQDVMDGIRKHVSVGYIVHAARLMDYNADTDTETWRITDWEPTEISIVAIPADPNVGINRSNGNTVKNTPSLTDSQKENSTMSPEGRNMNSPSKITSATVTASDDQEHALATERKRTADLTELGRQYNASDLALEFINNPTGTVEAMQRALLERQGKSQPLPAKSSDIGMSERDMDHYSVLKVVRALAEPGNKRLQAEIGFERELSQEAEKHQVRSNGGLVIPSDVLMRGIPSAYSLLGRDFNTGGNGQTGTGSTGSETIATSLLAGSYIDALRNSAVFMRGTRSLGGLVGNIDIPKQMGISQGYWIGEGEDAPDTAFDFSQVALSPKTVAATTEITRKMLNQSSLDIEALVRRDLAKSMGLTLDMTGYYGTGMKDKQPQGLFNTEKVQKKTLSGAFPSYAELVDMETAIALQNADTETMRFKVRPDLRGYAKQTPKMPATSSGIVIWEPGGTLNGYATDVTNQLQVGDFVHGDFNQVIVAFWGGLEISVDPYSRSKSGSLTITTFQDIDFGIRYPEAFLVGKAASPKAQAGK